MKIEKITIRIPAEGRRSPCLTAKTSDQQIGSCVNKKKLKKHLTAAQIVKLNELDFEEYGVRMMTLRINPEIIKRLQKEMM